MIKLGVDGRLITGNLTGVGKYILNLIEYVAINIPEIEIRVYTNRDLKILFVSKNITIVRDRKIFVRIKPMVWSKFFSHRLINTDKPDIYLSGDTFVPLFLKVKKIISVVHDVAYLTVPETMSRLHLLMSKVFFKRDLSKADAVITNSNGTAEKVQKYFQRNTDVVFYPIMDDCFIRLDAEEIKKELQKLGITFLYILSVATQEPRKNLDKTINAFMHLKKKGALKNFKLLLIGSKGWRNAEIDSLIDLYSGDIINLGYVSNYTLPSLYNGTELFVFPSKYEGFGMPPREAMLCGAKVLVNNTPELREATYGLADYLDNLDEENFGNQILRSIAEGKRYSKEQLESLATYDQREKIISLMREAAAF